MFRFESPDYLYLLAVIPVLALLRIMMIRGRRRKLRRFGDPKLLASLMPDVSRWRPEVKFWLLEAALAVLILMVARPQMGTRISNEKRTGIETVIALDVSNSMKAEDVAPNRLDRAKMMMENLVDKFTDDKIALIVFAGDAFVQLPITSDYVSAKMFLNDISPAMIASQGTDIARAIEMGTHSFTSQEGIGRAIIVITDGEDHEGGAVEAAQKAKKLGMRVFVLGIGSPGGAPVPDGQGGYMKDNIGNTVMSTLNEDMCKQVAEAGGGVYIHVENNSNAQEQLNSELAKLSQKEMESVVYSDYDEQFQAFGLIALLLLIAEVCLLECRSPLFKNVSLFSRKKRIVTITALFLLSSTAFAQSDRQYVRDGNKAFRAGDYANAEVAYRKAVEKNPRNPQAVFNLGNALFAQKKDSAAVQQYEQAAKLETNPKRRAMSYHNIGVVCQSHKMYSEAIEAYKEALRLTPNDDETRYNLALCKRQQKNQNKQNQNKQQQKQDKNKDNKDNQQQDKKQQQDKQQKQDKQKQEDKDKMSKENAEQLLNAAVQQEKNTQERMKKAMRQPNSRKLQKNW